jgi:excisionase family DNA binding protein
MRVIEKADIAPLEPLLCSIKAGSALLGVSGRFIIDAIAMGKISAVKTGRRTLLKVDSLKKYAAELPAAKGTPLARRRVTYEIQRMR